MVLELKELTLGSKQEESFQYELVRENLGDLGAPILVGPARVRGKAQKQPDCILLQCTVEFTLQYACDRCAAVATRPFCYSFEHALLPESDPQVDDGYFRIPGDTLDLDELIRADCLLELPSKLLCRDDCKGLCPQCGTNWNEHSCTCSQNQVDPRLEVLKQFID